MRFITTKRLPIHVACFFLAVVVAGCGSLPAHQGYPGPARSDQEHARISGKVVGDHKVLAGLNETILITCIDGVSLDQYWSLKLTANRYPLEALVLPGRHYIGIAYFYAGSYATGAMWFDAGAGRAYGIQHEPRRGSVYFWITDRATGTMAGGPIGNEPNPAGPEENCSKKLHRDGSLFVS
jgi:hypothetical protein